MDDEILLSQDGGEAAQMLLQPGDRVDHAEEVDEDDLVSFLAFNACPLG